MSRLGPARRPAGNRGAQASETPRSVALIGTYVPRRCGIATFTSDLARALDAVAGSARVSVIALNDHAAGYDYPDEVEFEIHQNRLRDYRVAADYLNANRIDAVCLQHEYGIFGGADGSHIVKLIGRLRMPVVTTVHTVLERPTASQKQVIEQLAESSERLVVMSETARRFLVDIYRIADAKIAFAPHGILDVPFVDPAYYKDQLGVEGRIVLLSFGLLSPDKGIEHMIRALPRVIAARPETVYVVLGATHPHVLESQGETYRLQLQRLARELGVDDRVIFHDRWVDTGELCEFLGAADIYVTPYLNEEQIVSGTLAYAMGAGKAVVSTPYWYAQEMLAEGRGRLVGFADPAELADTIVDLLSNEIERHAMRKRAYRFSRRNVWAEVARRYLQIIQGARRERQRRPRIFRAVTARDPLAPVPEINLAHLRCLTDDTGILQHATYFVPNRSYGYCTDDNARALIVATSARSCVPESEEVDRLVVRYLSFLQHAFDAERGAFRNFLGYDRRWAEGEGSPDSHGRGMWALGVTAAASRDERLRSLSARLLHRSFARLETVPDLRPTAFALLGITAYLEVYGGDTAARRVRDVLFERLHGAFQAIDDAESWPWPESALTYANARLPQALLVAGRHIGDAEAVERALASLSWLLAIQAEPGHFSPVGNRGWYRRGGARARFDQQPIEAEAMVSACVAAFRATAERAWVDRAMLAFEWFLGRNDVGQLLYDLSTGGCRDGLGPTGVSDNQGAESTLAWLGALLEIHALQADGELGWTRDRAAGGSEPSPRVAHEI